MIRKYVSFRECCVLINKLKPYLMMPISLDYYGEYNGTVSQYEHLLHILEDVEVRYNNDLRIFPNPSDIDRRFIIKEKNRFVKHIPLINPFKLEEIRITDSYKVKINLDIS